MPTPVRIVKLGQKKPARVLCRFEDDEYEGGQEWLIPSRLVAPWDGLRGFLDREESLARLIAVGRPDDIESSALDIIEQRYLSDVARRRTPSGQWGLLDIVDVEGLATLTGLDKDEMTRDGWSHDGIWTVPLTTTRKVTVALARINADDLLRFVAREEESAREAAAVGQWSRGRNPTYIEPEIAAEVFEDFEKPYFDLLRSWAGAEAKQRHDETRLWKHEAWRLYRLLDESIESLRKSGQRETAWQLHKQLHPEANRKTWKTTKEAERERDERRAEATRARQQALGSARTWELWRRRQEDEAEIWSDSWKPRKDWDN